MSAQREYITPISRLYLLGTLPRAGFPAFNAAGHGARFDPDFL